MKESFDGRDVLDEIIEFVLHGDESALSGQFTSRCLPTMGDSVAGMTYNAPQRDLDTV